MIEIKNATKRFGALAAVDNLTLNIDQGIYGLVGQNGAGKSTLFRLISDVFTLTEGSINIDSFPNDTKEAKELVFFLSDDPYVEKNDNVRRMLDFYGNFYDIDKENFYRLIEKFGLPREGMISKFSKGMKRQTFISLALSINTKYLLLDEAFDGLDPIVLESIKEELLKAKDQGKVIVASSHNINTLESLVDTFILITKGKLSNRETKERFGQNYIKYQAIFTKEVNEENFKNSEIKLVSLKKYGSIYNIVLLETENMEEKINAVCPTSLLERVPIDSEEIVKLSMMVARKESGNENE